VADLGRAVLLGSIPLAAVGGWLTLPQVFVVASLAAVLTTFFDVADKAYLPTIVPRPDLVRANGAIAATSSAVEFAGFGLGGVLVGVLSAPIAILVDAVTFIGSAILLGAIRHPEPAPPPAESREPILAEIGAGMRLVAGDPILRGLLWGTFGVSAQWGVFGSVWLLFATKEVGLDAAVIGVIAAIGGLGSLAGALLASRTTGRYGVGRIVVTSVAVAACANLLIALAPAALPLVAIACFLGQQLIGDSALTMYDVTDVSIRQSRVETAQLGRVNGTIRVVSVMAQLGGAVLAGIVGELLGLRVAAFLGPILALIGAAGLWLSPVGRLRS
jgi:hypothetical protein